MTNPRIAVFGAGANGGAIAASLADAGADITAFDPWPQHVESVRRDGISVTTTTGEHTTQLDLRHLCELAETKHPFDLIVLGVKAYDTRWASELLLPYLAEDGTVVAVQNGVTLDTVADVFGADRAVGAVIEVAANLMTPGRIVQEAPMWLALGGETPAAQDRAEAAGRALAPAAKTVVVDDIRSAKWMKLVANACELVPSAIVDLPLADAIALPGMYDVMLATGQETLDVALSAGHKIVPIFDSGVDSSTLQSENYVKHLLGVVLSDYTFPGTLTTVLQDWRKGRRAEIDDLNGLVVTTAGGPGKAPLNDQVRDIALSIESHRLTAGPQLAQHLVSKLSPYSNTSTTTLDTL